MSIQSIWTKPDGADYSDKELEDWISLRLNTEFVRITKLLYAAHRKLDLTEEDLGYFGYEREIARLSGNKPIRMIMPSNPNTPGWMRDKFGLDFPSTEFSAEIQKQGVWAYWSILDFELRLMMAEFQSRHCDDCELLNNTIFDHWRLPTTLTPQGRVFLGHVSINQKEYTETWHKYEKLP